MRSRGFLFKWLCLIFSANLLEKIANKTCEHQNAYAAENPKHNLRERHIDAQR